MSNAAKWWMGQVAQLPCVVCGAYGVNVHHLTGQAAGRGIGRKVADTLTIPLCVECHNWLHSAGTKAWERACGAQIDLLAATIENVARRLMK